jgi:hypothetical protein
MTGEEARAMLAFNRWTLDKNACFLIKADSGFAVQWVLKHEDGGRVSHATQTFETLADLPDHIAIELFNLSESSEVLK